MQAANTGTVRRPTNAMARRVWFGGRGIGWTKSVFGGAPAGRNVGERLYEMIYRSLAGQIAGGGLPSGLVLLEGAIADAFQVSRAPVKAALRLLARDGLVQRFDGRGYMIPGRGAPLRVALKDAGLRTGNDRAEEAAPPRAGWERIYTSAEREIGAALPFGRFRVLEARMASHYGVSRTVVRDVLSRMHERRLIAKDARSHWVAGPLTAGALREYYEIRRILEPAALLLAAPRLDADVLAAMRARVRAVASRRTQPQADTMLAIDEDLHIRCVQRTGNFRLTEMIQDSQTVLIANHTFLRYLGVPEELPELEEHRVIFDLLLQGNAEAAAAALRAHLDRSLDRALSRLKVLSVIPLPELPGFLAATEP
jgi:DNA-binding GntR family transcriptional regulator